MKHWSATLAQAVVRHRWAVLAAGLLITLGMGFSATKLQVENNPDLWSPQDHDYIKATHEIEGLFGGRHFTIVGIVPQSGDVYRPEVLTAIRNIQTGLEQIPDVIKANVVSIAARRAKDVQGTAEGMSIKPMLPASANAPSLDDLKAAIARNPIYRDMLVTSDGKAAAVVADFHVKGEYTPLVEKIKAVVDNARVDGVDFLLGGEPVHSANLEAAMLQMPAFFGAAFLVISLIQFLAFRSVQGVLVPMVSGITSVVWGLGTIAACGAPLDPLNSTTPILIMAIAAGHSIQMLKRFYEEFNRNTVLHPEATRREVARMAVATSLEKVAPVMLTAGAISALAFFSLMASDITMIRHFGLFAGAGAFSIVIVELTVIPALRSVLPIAKREAAAKGILDEGLDSVGRLLDDSAGRLKIFIGAVIVIAVVSAGILRLKVDNSFKQYSAVGSAIRKDDDRLNSIFAGTNSMSFLVTGATENRLKAPDVLKAMDGLQRYLDGQTGVGKTQSIVQLVKRMNLAMNGDADAYNAVPDSAELISQYFFLYFLSAQPSDLDNLVDRDFRRGVVWAYLKNDSTFAAIPIVDGARQFIDREFPKDVQVRIGGGIPETIAIDESVVHTKLLNIAQMAIVVFVLSSFALRSLVGGIFVVVPLALIVVVNLGMMGWAGIPLDMGTATTSAMVVGLGADYEIYMLYRLREEFGNRRNLADALRASLLTSGKAVMYVALSVAGGYSVLLVAQFQFYPRLGATMVTTMVCSAALSLLLLRAVIATIRPTFITRGQSPR